MSHASPTAEPVSLPPAKGFALVGGLLALAIAAGVTVVAGLFLGDRSATDPRRLVFSYLTSLMFVTSVSVGALGLGDVAPPDRRGLVGGHPATAGEPHAAAPLDRDPLHPDRSEPEPALSLGRPVASRRRPWPGARRSGSTRFFSTSGQPFISSPGRWSRVCWRGVPSARTRAAIRPRVVGCGRPAHGA